jgi:protein TonB
MPKFPGDMDEFIVNHVQFPQYLRDLGVDGIVYVNFIVETDGSVSNVKILRGIAGAEQLSTETVNAVNIMPKWSPGMQGGHPVRVQYMLPVHFKIL